MDSGWFPVVVVKRLDPSWADRDADQVHGMM